MEHKHAFVSWWTTIEQYWRVPLTTRRGYSTQKLITQLTVGLVIILALTSGYLATQQDLAARSTLTTGEQS